MDAQNRILVDEITKMLLGGSAHASFKDAIKGIKPALRGEKVKNMPYSIWQLLEHIRIAQWDMLQFCKDPAHQSPKWPDDYWPKENAPASEEAWNGAISQVQSDLDEFIELLEHADIYQPIGHGTGQNVLREAFQIAAHTSYHTGEIIAIRRLLANWP